MICRVIGQRQPLCAALLELKKSDLMPSDTEFLTMETYVEVTKPLVARPWGQKNELQYLHYDQFFINFKFTPSRDI